jgi:hypothetical protein
LLRTSFSISPSKYCIPSSSPSRIGVEQRLALRFALLDVLARAHRRFEDLEHRDPTAILLGYQPL